MCKAKKSKGKENARSPSSVRANTHTLTQLHINQAEAAINIMIQLIIPIMGFIAGKPVSWIMIAPSVTPKKQSIGSNNPAMRLYKFDTDTGQVSVVLKKI